MGVYKIIYDKLQNKLYEGEFEGELRAGRGRLYYPSGGIKYTGEWESDNPSGMGVLFYENGAKFYEGKWLGGSACGQGVLYTDTGRIEYEGQFEDSKKNGIGTIYYEDGVKYKGEWILDKKSGFGSLYYASGELNYRGSWKDSKREGSGTIFGNDNLILYKGEFCNDKKHGRGRSYYIQGNLEYDGEWFNDEKSGEGVLYNRDGLKIFEGFFSRGKRLEANVVKILKTDVEIPHSENLDIKIDAYDEKGQDIIDKSLEIIYEDEPKNDIEYKNNNFDTLESFIGNKVGEFYESENEHSTVENNILNNDKFDIDKFDDEDEVIYEVYGENSNINEETQEVEESDDISEEITEVIEEELESEMLKDNRESVECENIVSESEKNNSEEVVVKETEESLNLIIDNDEEVYNYIEKGDYIYKGIFSNNEATGNGKVFYKNKLKYSGELYKGSFDGNGKLYDTKEKVSYEGFFRNGKKFGFGVSYDSFGNIIYTGEWKDDIRCGVGKLLNSNGEEIYSGKFYNGKALGLGNDIEAEIDNILYKELEAMVGLEEVKDDIARLVSFLKMQIIRGRIAYKTIDIPYIFTFEGNIGVGKESIARILGKLYYILGLVPEYNFIQTDLSQALDYSHDGEIEEAMDSFGGGVLYLSNLYENDYADAVNLIKSKEATNNIMNLIDYSNGHFIIIFSGDEDLIETMIHNKKELVKLVGKSIIFFDYSVEEMMDFVGKISKEKDYELENDLLKMLKEFFEEVITNDKVSNRNAEFVKEVFIEIVKEQCIRIDTYGIEEVTNIKILKVEDFENIKNKICF